MAQALAEREKFISGLWNRIEETPKAERPRKDLVTDLRGQTEQAGRMNVFQFLERVGEVLDQLQRVGVKDAVRVVGSEEDDDRVVKPEVLADLLVLLDFGGIGGNQGVAVGAELEA